MTGLDSAAFAASLAAAAFLLGWRLGRFRGRGDVAMLLTRVVAARRARIAQDDAEHRDVFRDAPRLSEAERDLWNARDLG